MEEEANIKSSIEPKTLDILERAQLLIVRVCDEGPEFFQRDINKLKEFFITQINEKDNEKVKEEIIKKLVECICLINRKGSIYATVVSLIEQKIAGFAENIIDRVLDRLQEALDEGQMIIPKFALIFLGEIMNIGLINNFTFITLLYDLISEAEKNSNDSFDYYLYIVISILPYLSSTLLDKSALEFKSLVDNIKAIMVKRNKSHLPLLLAIKASEPTDFLEELWQEFSSEMEEDSLRISGMVKPYDLFSAELKGIKQIKKNKKLFFHAKKNECTMKTLPYIKIFTEEILNSQKEKMSKLDRMLLFDDLKDLIQFSDFYFRLCQLNRKVLIQNLLFYKSTLYYTPVLIEVIFNLITTIPVTPINVLVYSSVLLMLGKDSSEAKNNIGLIRQSFKFFFDQSANMDPEALLCVTKTLAIYLSNTYKFSESRINLEEYESSSNNFAQKFFLHNTFWHFKSYISKKIEDEEWVSEFKEYIPENETYFLNHLKADSENYTDAEIMLDKFNVKTDDEEMFEFLDNSAGNSLLCSSTRLLLRKQKRFS